MSKVEELRGRLRYVTPSAWYGVIDETIAAAKEEERASIRVKAEWCGKSDELGNMVMVPASMLNPDKPKEADNDNS